RRTMPGSNVTPASAESATDRETPCDTASFLKSSSQRSNGVSLRHGAPRAGGAAARKRRPTERAMGVRMKCPPAESRCRVLYTEDILGMSRKSRGKHMDRISPDALRILGELEKKVLWLASWTIHHANHVRENIDGLKVGGHQASSASLATIMTALYFQ